MPAAAVPAACAGGETLLDQHGRQIGVPSWLETLGRRALAGERLGRPDALALTALRGAERYALLAWADRVRRARFGNRVSFCSIVPGKLGACAEDCKWCAQSLRHGAQELPARRATGDELLAAAEEARAAGSGRLGIVNSGRRPTDADLDALAEAVPAILRRGGVACCASLGELDEPAARRLAAMGVHRYHHNLETSRRFYATMVTTHDYDSRLATCAAARRAGMSVCSGGLFGLGESWEDRVDLAMTLRDEIRPDCVPLNFLHPVPGTPLAGALPLEPLECLHVVALFRMLLPAVDLRIAGGRLVNLRDAQSWLFHAGATSLMVGNYLTTSGRRPSDDRQMVEDLGYVLVPSSTPLAGAAGAATAPAEAEEKPASQS